MKRIAKALDVGLIVRFASYGDVVRWRLSASQADMAPPSFARDEMLHAGIQAFFHGITHIALRPIKSRTRSSDVANGQQALQFDADTARGIYWQGSIVLTKAARAA